MTRTIPIFCIAAFLFGSCCKIQTNFIGIDQVKFINFSISEIDTFYTLPYFADSSLSWSSYPEYRETSSSLSTTLQKNKLIYTRPIEIVLKDTNKRFIIQATKSISKKDNGKRCSPVSLLITEFEVNGHKQEGDTIRIE